MKTTYTIVLTALLSFVLSAPDAALAYSERPIDTIKRTNTTLNKLLRKKNPSGSPTAKKVDEALKKTIYSFLDFEELAKQALGKHWEKRSAKERAEFVQILRDLIERNYLKQLKSNLDYKLEYRNEDVSGHTAKVFTVIKVERNHRVTEIVVEYRMRKASEGWMVYDVVTDDVSIVRNYRSQFNRIIQKNSYEHLVQKMRSKLQEG